MTSYETLKLSVWKTEDLTQRMELELYKACSRADNGPWRQSGVLKELRVQLLRGLMAPMIYRP